MQTYFTSEHNKENIFTIGFYNLENLYDIYNDPVTHDDEFTPISPKHWNIKRYHQKIEQLSEVITQIGVEHSEIPPVVLGIAEVENEAVVKDLVMHTKMKEYDYEYVHFDSPDERGIEVAFLYQRAHFDLLTTQKIPIILYKPDGDRDYTRDILLVKGNYKGELMCFFVNHWSSRRDGVEQSEYKRMEAAKLVSTLIHKEKTDDPNAKIVVMGDFNDEPNNESIQYLVSTSDLYNPMQSLKDKEIGSSYSQDRWYLFDQIIVSKNFFDLENNKFLLKFAEVFNPKFIQTWKGKRKNSPFRSYFGKFYQGGFSDHFPVVAYLERL